MNQLAVEQLSKHFGGLAVLNDVTLAVPPGEKRAIIGPNGAGKSTLFNLIAGELAPSRGSVYFEGRDITRLAVHQRARLGLGRTFQQNNLFPGLTIFETVRLAIQHRLGITKHLFKRASGFESVNQEVAEILSQVGLIGQRNERSSTLAYGQRRILEVALALATQPKILLLDEPTAGMSPAETVDLIQLIESLPPSLTVLIVEHDMDVVFSLADRITVLHYGQVISEGVPAEVRADPQVQEIYLGNSNLDEPKPMGNIEFC